MPDGGYDEALSQPLQVIEEKLFGIDHAQWAA
jgi:hypothetical protein